MAQPETIPPLEALLTPKEVAGLLKCSRSLVYRWAEEGTLPSRKLGGLLRFEAATVRRFMAGELPSATVVPIRGA